MALGGDGRLVALIWLLSSIVSSFGSYVILFPKSWEIGGLTQVCIVVDDASAIAGEITLAASADRRMPRIYSRTYSRGGPYGPGDHEHQEEEVETSVVYLPPTTIRIPPGKVELCEDLQLNDVEDISYNDRGLTILGEVAGNHINVTQQVNFNRVRQHTVIQTDKYLYKPGQMVSFRILSHYGPLMNVSTEKYPEIWVTTPSGTRIAQWKHVENPGLVHLEMQLADEPEEGRYQIHVKTSKKKNSGHKTIDFKVEEYVLPRFEVTFETPKNVLARDPSFSFKVCAKYTFGQPVKGDLSVRISNNGHRKCRTIITKNETFSGCHEISVSSSDIRTVDCSINSVSVHATVAEEGTGVELYGSDRISISRNAVSFKTLYNDRYMKYNLPYNLKVRAESPDDSPASDVLVELCYDGSCSNMTTPADGVINVNVMNYDSRKVVLRSLVTRADMYDASHSANIERYYSPSNSSIMIHAPEGDLECTSGEVTEHNLQVLFSTPGLSSAKISVQVISRDRIQYWASKEYNFEQTGLPYEDENRVRPRASPSGSGTTGVINIPIKLPNTASPTAWVLVWYIRADGEVVSDSRKLIVKKCLPNNVNLHFSANEAEPGQQTTLSLSAAPGSLCSLGIVDKSVELLTPKFNALTLDTFFNSLGNSWSGHRSQINNYQYCRDLMSAELGHRSGGYFTDYVDALKMFDDTGLFVFSDLKLETRPCEKQESSFGGGPIGGYSRGGGALSSSSRVGQPQFDMAPMSSASNVDYDDPGMSEERTFVEQDTSNVPRTDFPETWLWDLVSIPSDVGVNHQQVTMPDTITEWVGKAVCVDSKMGIGLSERTTITTFTAFFLDMTLPPSMKRGEILPVKISVFNYLDEAIPVSVLLQESAEYEILESATETLCLEPKNMKVHTIKIRPSVIGDVNITVSAYVDHRIASNCGARRTRVDKRDSMVRPITVEAEGFPREKTWTKYICSDELAAGDDSLETWEVSAPPAIVEGSDRGWVMVVGDLLALSVENLGHLIRMPYGCGEQNMLNFAPNIYILQYLDATSQNAPEAKEKLVKYMRTGYQRQLLYLRNDGSFSAFGNADTSGSTFLTAFVLKSLAQAREYILIDKQTIKRTKKWLTKKQGTDGCYQSVGTLFNKAMKGGISEDGSSVPLTAYVMISLLEAGEEKMAVQNASNCLQSHTSQDAYIIALKAYAFALAQDDSTESLIDQLLQLATDTKTSLHWDLRRSSWRSRSLEVETAGYAILAMLKWNPSEYEQQIRKVVKWMSSERNGQGGFISTQDTVVALQAMASFESHLDRGTLDADIAVKGTDLAHSFSVDESNKLLQQQVAIPSLPNSLSLGMTGEGCVLMQAVLRYNIPEPEASDSFGLTISSRTVRDKSCVTKQIEFCARYLLPDGKSNMAVIEVNLVSGYIPVKDDLKKLVKETRNRNFKRYEVDGSKISLYLDELMEENTCGSIRITRDVNVEDAKPGSVVVYDYYQPEFSLSKSYKLPPADDCLYAY